MRADCDAPENMVFVPFCYAEAAAAVWNDVVLDPKPASVLSCILAVSHDRPVLRLTPQVRARRDPLEHATTK